MGSFILVFIACSLVLVNSLEIKPTERHPASVHIVGDDGNAELHVAEELPVAQALVADEADGETEQRREGRAYFYREARVLVEKPPPPGLIQVPVETITATTVLHDALGNEVVATLISYTVPPLPITVEHPQDGPIVSSEFDHYVQLIDGTRVTVSRRQELGNDGNLTLFRTTLVDPVVKSRFLPIAKLERLEVAHDQPIVATQPVALLAPTVASKVVTIPSADGNGYQVKTRYFYPSLPAAKVSTRPYVHPTYRHRYYPGVGWRRAYHPYSYGRQCVSNRLRATEDPVTKKITYKQHRVYVPCNYGLGARVSYHDGVYHTDPLARTPYYPYYPYRYGYYPYGYRRISPTPRHLLRKESLFVTDVGGALVTGTRTVYHHL